MLTNIRLKHFLMAILLVGGLSLTSCGGSDDEPDSPDEEQNDDVYTNPMIGKTIRYVNSWGDELDRFHVDYAITFNSDTEYTQVNKVQNEGFDLAKKQWILTNSTEVETKGTYTYSDSEIVLRTTYGSVTTLKKCAQGWADGEEVYK